MVAMVTYFSSKMFVKYEHFSNQAHFFIIIFKKKWAIDLKIFNFSHKFWRKYVVMATMICVKHFMNIPDNFLYSCFKIFEIFHKNLGGKYVAMATTIKRIKKNLSGMFTKCFTHMIMVAMATYFFPNFCVKNENFSNQAHFFLYYF
jgi:hypothetical protein